METKYFGYRIFLLKLLLVVFGFGLQAFVCDFSRQNICSVVEYINGSKKSEKFRSKHCRMKNGEKGKWWQIDPNVKVCSKLHIRSTSVAYIKNGVILQKHFAQTIKASLFFPTLFFVHVMNADLEYSAGGKRWIELLQLIF